MIKNIFLLLILAITIASCSKNNEHAMTVQGSINGLQKGTLYLQKMQDTSMVIIDSVALMGKSDFVLVDDNPEAQLYYLMLKEKADEKINFFGEKGTITINSKLSKFYSSAKIEGSKPHKLLEKYRKMISKFNGKRLELIKETFKAQTAKNNEDIVRLDKELKSLVKNRYRYSVNFAVKNSNSEVAPFIALTELYDAHISLLDTVNKSLSEKVKNSIYGKKLDAFVKDIKANEK